MRTPQFEVNRGITASLWVYLHSTGRDSTWGEQILNCGGSGTAGTTSTTPLSSTIVIESSAFHDAWQLRTWSAALQNHYATAPSPTLNLSRTLARSLHPNASSIKVVVSSE